MSWHLLEKLLDEVSKQSTFVGKVWITLLFVFRIVAITRIADTVYADEQAAFKCNTKQPGCENVCFNDFSPISHVRFWGFQVIIVATPSMIFIVYALHVVSKLPRIFRLSGRQVEVTTFKNRKKGCSGSLPPKQSTFTSGKFPGEDEKTMSSKTQRQVNEYEPFKQRRFLGGHLADVISFGDYPNIIEDSDRESPPAYNHHPSFYYKEISVGNVLPNSQNVRSQTSQDDLYTPKETCSRGTQKSPFSPFSGKFRSFPKRRVRRHSESDITPTSGGKRSFQTYFGSFSGSSCDLTSYDDVTSRRYTVAKEFSLNDIWRERSDSWSDCRTRHKPAIASTMKSEVDSAFSEKSTSSEGVYVMKPSPRPAAATERCSSIHTHSTRFVTSQNKPQRSEGAPTSISHCDVKYSANSDPSKTAGAPSGCSGRFFTPSRISSCHRSVRARAVIKRLEDRIAIAYLMQCILRLLLETAFLALQYLMFNFHVPEIYQCERSPCPHVVDCFISRPQEKSTLLYFMFGVSALCIALTWHEIVMLCWRMCRKSRDQRMKQKLAGAGSLATLTHAGNKEKKTKCDANDIFLLDRYAKYIQARNGDFDYESSSDSKTHSSSSDSDSTNDQESFNSEDLSSMFDNENMDIGDFTENVAVEGGDDFV